jgi:hypothetical protein
MSVRLIHLDADPPDWYVGGDVGYHVDEGYKTLAAKNLYLFGATTWHPDDDYRGWIRKSPATQYPIYWAYEIFGLDLTRARLISLAYTLAFLLATVIFLSHRLSGPVLVLTTVMMTADLALFQFSRVALFEATQIACVYVSIYLMTLVDRRSHLLALMFLVLAAFLTASFVKAQAPLYFLPAIVAVMLSTISGRSLRHTGLLLTAGMFCSCLLLYYFRTAWVHRVDIEPILVSPQLVFYNPLSNLTPGIAVTGYLVVIDILLRDRDALYKCSYRFSLAAILLAAPIILSFVPYHPPRYYMPVIPAAILLVGDWLQMRSRLPRIQLGKLAAADIAVLALLTGSIVMLMTLSLCVWWYPRIATRLLDSVPYWDVFAYPAILNTFWFSAAIVGILVYATRKTLKKTGIAWLIYAGVAAHVALGIAYQWKTLHSPSFNRRIIEKELISRVDSEESIGGDWAPMLTASSNLRVHYMNKEKNRPDVDEFVRPTYFLYAGSNDDEIVLDLLKSARDISLGEGEVLGTYFRSRITLHRLLYVEPLPSPENAP